MTFKEVNKAIQVTKRRASIKPTNETEAKRFVLSQLKKKPHIKWVIGIDEVGRGPVAGPVTMCAFGCSVEIFKKGLAKHFQNKQSKFAFTDSKKMSGLARGIWNAYIRKHTATSKEIYFEIGSKDAKFIDKKGISVAIRTIILKLLTAFEKKNIHHGNTFVVLDGALFAPDLYEQITVIKGDAHLEPISLASILAKEHRDSYMKKVAAKFPEYSFESHVGYGTSGHMKAIKKHGVSEIHRKTFLKRAIK